METYYYVEIKGSKENEHNWRSAGMFSTLKAALKHYNFFKSGCDKRINRVRIIRQEKIVRHKKY